MTRGLLPRQQNSIEWRRLYESSLARSHIYNRGMTAMSLILSLLFRTTIMCFMYMLHHCELVVHCRVTRPVGGTSGSYGENVLLACTSCIWRWAYWLWWALEGHECVCFPSTHTARLHFHFPCCHWFDQYVTDENDIWLALPPLPPIPQNHQFVWFQEISKCSCKSNFYLE